MLDGSDDFRRPCTIGVQCPQSRLSRHVFAVIPATARPCGSRVPVGRREFGGGWQQAWPTGRWTK
ncbi:MAG: hypothetical protein E2583_15420 [Comamonas sp.]|nr:hypothetical protein [Comamonas sp.]